MAKVKVYHDTRSVKVDGTCPIKIRVNHVKVFFLGTELSARPGDFEDGRFRRDAIRTSLLTELLNRVDKELYSLELNNKLSAMSDAALKLRLQAVVSNRPSTGDFLPYYDKVVSEKAITAQTRDSYRNARNYLAQYAPTLQFSDINRAWVDGFVRFMQSQPLEPGTIAAYIYKVRAVCTTAIDDELMLMDPFRKMVLERSRPRHKVLTVEQLRNMMDQTCMTKTQKLYADFFMLDFFLIGINPQDFFSPDTIWKNGRVEYVRAKTGKYHPPIKIQPEAQAILDRYTPIQKFLGKKPVRHFVACLDISLKNICRGNTKERLEPGLSINWARHTWATIAHQIGIPKDVISMALGHSFGVAITDVYIDYDYAKVDEANRKVIDYVLQKQG